MMLLEQRFLNTSLCSARILLVMLGLLLLGDARLALAASKDDPLLAKVLLDQFEVADVDTDRVWLLDGQGWVGKDLQKLWWKVALERESGDNEEIELQALYSQAVAPFWDLQVGLRQNSEPGPRRSWAVIGVQGLAPYFFDIDAALFFGESGRSALRIEVEYELLFTQKLILSPEIEMNVYGQSDEALGLGSGLSDIEAGLRLRYEVRREFAPYIGVSRSKRFSGSADFSRRAGEDTDVTQWLLGVRVWF